MYLGLITATTGVLLFVPALAAVFLGEIDLVKYFIIPGVLSILIGYVPQRGKKIERIDLKSAYIICALGWLIATFVGCIPYVLIFKASLLDAYFETMSGWTTSGITVFTPSQLPKSLILWRSFTEWLGGVGIVMAFLAIFAPSPIASRFYFAEARTDRIEPNIVNTAKKTFYIYIGFTVICAILLFLAGAPVFDAINHSLTALPTGGFSPHDDSYFTMSPIVKIITMIFMVVGGISFAVHMKWIRGDYKSLYTSLEVKALIAIVVIFAFLLYFDGMPLVDSFFQSISAITTTGFASVNISGLSELSKAYIIILMNVGGSYGATASGIKLMRFVVALKSVEWFIRKITSPSRAIIPFKLQGRVFSEEEVLATLLFCLLYIVLQVPSILIFMYTGRSFMDAVFMVSSAMGNNGLVTLTTYTSVEKILMIFHMWIGRLEIIPVLILFAGWRRM
jgi:trk system potassium uptake protein TrkH